MMIQEKKGHESTLDLDVNSISDIAFVKYKSHPSIITISKNVSFEPQIKLKDVNKNNVRQQVLNLNSKKPGTFGDIPIRNWKVLLMFEI